MGVDKVNAGCGLVYEEGQMVLQLWVGKGTTGLHACVTLTEAEYDQARIEARAGVPLTGQAGAFVQGYQTAGLVQVLAVAPHSGAWG